jgi:S1-C subfamily serine protease
MKNCLFVLVLLLVKPVYAETPLPQCVRVFTHETDDTPSAGSGALIGRNTVVTCYHVVKDRTGKIEVLFPNWEVITGRVWKEDKTLDIAIIVLDRNASYEPLTISRVKSLPTELSIHGYGYGVYQSQTGTLNPKTYGPDTETGIWKQVDGAIARGGDSGGPILGPNGQYCGTLWGANPDGTMFVPVYLILPLFETAP